MNIFHYSFDYNYNQIILFCNFFNHHVSNYSYYHLALGNENKSICFLLCKDELQYI